MSTDTAPTVPTRFVEAGGVRFAYRRWGKSGGLPLVFLQYFGANLDDWDPQVTDGLADEYDVILFDNAGVGSSGQGGGDRGSRPGRGEVTGGRFVTIVPRGRVGTPEEVAADHQNDIFAGANDLIETIGGRPPMSLEAFIEKRRRAFE